MAKVVSVTDGLKFDDGTFLGSDHDQDCCEHHYLDFSGLSINDFDGLEFNLDSSNFFERVEDYGIRLCPTNGHPDRVPGYGYNNGYYSANLKLVLTRDRENRVFDITECQDVKD